MGYKFSLGLAKKVRPFKYLQVPCDRRTAYTARFVSYSRFALIFSCRQLTTCTVNNSVVLWDVTMCSLIGNFRHGVTSQRKTVVSRVTSVTASNPTRLTDFYCSSVQSHAFCSWTIRARSHTCIWIVLNSSWRKIRHSTSCLSLNFFREFSIHHTLQEQETQCGCSPL
jgi:hypothetical protein